MRYIIIEQDRGIFLGNYEGIQIFSNELIFPIIKACSFRSLTEVEKIMRFIEGDDLKVAEINYNERYIPIDILIKAGYSDYTGLMLRFVPNYSDTIH